MSYPPEAIPIVTSSSSPSAPPAENYISTNCPQYKGYGCTLLSISVFLIVFVLFLGFAGPWYSDCEHNDCSVQKTNGLFCDDYCISGNSGPGSLLVVFCLGGILISAAFPYCCVDPDLRRRRRDLRHRASLYDIEPAPYYAII
jgi:hypothetical protein